MKICVLFLVGYFIYTEALECGVVSRIDKNLKKIITSCLKANITAEDIFDFSNLSSKETPVVTQKTSENTTTSSPTTTQDIPNGKTYNRTSRGIKITPIRLMETTTMEPSMEPETESEVVTEEMNEPTENCILQCVLSSLNLTDEKGYPEHEKVVQGLLKSAEGRELQDFLEDSADMCFQKMNDEIPKNPCDYSLELVRCLADSGKMNCGDWPAGDISILNK